ncbi:peptide deformylase [Enteractinococcus fodinae]|uniref:Peptide deformylase n=1 Tax=Enteractinococcus fodinae TaxID=684663 RepID=A0ABU2B0X8_9MICC|nr:peptide deformylase [Enteractinococcus fodinae]MDR7347066.1 peptide deformylase [Enteractinococcus fodinae]
MSILTIRTVPDPVLRSKTTLVDSSRYGSTGLRRLIDSMHETMDAVEGVGLAAPQVGMSHALFVFNLENRQGHVINPVIQTWGPPQHEPKEGCLSVPELYYTPPRAQYAKVHGVNFEGRPVAYEGEGLFARMLQHEVDHLEGLLFVDRLEDAEFRQARRAMASRSFVEATKRVNVARSAEISSIFGTGPSDRQAPSKGRS